MYLTSVIWSCDTFENNLGIKYKFTKIFERELKIDFWWTIPFKYLPNVAFIREISWKQVKQKSTHFPVVFWRPWRAWPPCWRYPVSRSPVCGVFGRPRGCRWCCCRRRRSRGSGTRRASSMPRADGGDAQGAAPRTRNWRTRCYCSDRRGWTCTTRKSIPD